VASWDDGQERTPRQAVGEFQVRGAPHRPFKSLEVPFGSVPLFGPPFRPRLHAPSVPFRPSPLATPRGSKCDRQRCSGLSQIRLGWGQ